MFYLKFDLLIQYLTKIDIHYQRLTIRETKLFDLKYSKKLDELRKFIYANDEKTDWKSGTQCREDLAMLNIDLELIREIKVGL